MDVSVSEPQNYSFSATSPNILCKKCKSLCNFTPPPHHFRTILPLKFGKIYFSNLFPSFIPAEEEAWAKGLVQVDGTTKVYKTLVK